MYHKQTTRTTVQYTGRTVRTLYVPLMSSDWVATLPEMVSFLTVAQHFPYYLNNINLPPGEQMKRFIVLLRWPVVVANTRASLVYLYNHLRCFSHYGFSKNQYIIQSVSLCENMLRLFDQILMLFIESIKFSWEVPDVRGTVHEFCMAFYILFLTRQEKAFSIVSIDVTLHKIGVLVAIVLVEWYHHSRIWVTKYKCNVLQTLIVFGFVPILHHRSPFQLRSDI